MAINIHNLRVYNMTVGAGSSGGEGGGGGSSEPSYLAVGASRFSGFTGRAFVYDATNYSTSPTTITANDGSSGDRFGVSIATSNDYIVVGAQEGDGNVTDSGVAYVFSTSNLSATPTKLAPSDGAAANYFGQSVAISSDYIIAGAPFVSNLSNSAGAIYVYDTTNLSSTPTKLQPSNLNAYSYFGTSVAVTSNQIVAGAYRFSRGRVYVYDATNLSSNPTELISPATSGTPEFGYAVAANNSTVLVGAFGEQSVYVYDATNLSASPTKLTQSGDFGKAVAVTDTHVIVGDRKSGSYQGSVYVYDVTNLSSSPVVLTASDGQSGDEFGTSVSAIGSQIIVGAIKDDDAGGDAGAAYIYDATNLSAAPTKVTGLAGDDNFGASVSLG
jgi:hypothetical protein